ncbi:MAG: hypothetical protein AAF936_12245 [Pseudomonadota bacterium]
MPMAVVDQIRNAGSAAVLPVSLRMVLVASVLGAGLGVGLLGQTQERYLADPELAQLLRAFAVLKLAFLVPIALLAWVRFSSSAPLPIPFAAGYIVSVTIAAGALALIAKLAAVGAGSLLFHASIAGFIFLAFRDQGFVNSLKLLAPPRK